MEKMITCYCPWCKEETLHEIYLAKGGYLHSWCTKCGADVESRSKVGEICTTMTMKCSNEGDSRIHIKYISQGGYIHWFCCSCGKDIESNGKVDSCNDL